MISIITLVLLGIEAVMIIYCLNILNKTKNRVVYRDSDETKALKLEVWKLKYPPKYKVGQTTEDGELVYNVAFSDHGMAGGRWVYYTIKGDRKNCIQGSDNYYSWHEYI